MVEVTPLTDIIGKVVPFYKTRPPETEHVLVYDSPSETLEPVYFFTLDFMKDIGLNPEKILDNFVSSPGSGHFGELGQRASIMQQQGTKVLADINTVLRSILNLIYDLRDFKIRLQSYEDLKDPSKKDVAMMSLKQIWMDKVDINKGNSSIKAMALGQAGFQTLIDAFLISKDEKDAANLDLNDRVKRIIEQRVQEFNIWLSQSEKELRKRYALEKNYLRSQYNSLKLYSRWAKPYLRAAADLEMKESKDPGLVKGFNTTILELTVLGKREVKPDDLPPDVSNVKMRRKYYGCVLVDFYFRGIPQRIAQQSHYTFGGLATITCRGYALNEEELAVVRKEMEKSDIEDAFSLMKGATDESLANLQEEINYFLEEKDEEQEKKKQEDDSNPFKALVGGYNDGGEKPKDSSKKEKEIVIQKENWFEGFHLRKLAIEKAKDQAFTVFDTYKKAHRMPSPS